MECRALAVAVMLSIGATGCGTHNQLRGVVPLAGDGGQSWIYVETTSPEHNGIWYCVADRREGEPHARCVQAQMMKWAGESPAPTAE
jgi:hypothetical protein